MIVDLPEPDGPTRAVVLPYSNVQVKFFKTLTSGLDGYEKQTSWNWISPREVSLLTLVVPGSSTLIAGT
jgi:hypothetical protein